MKRMEWMVLWAFAMIITGGLVHGLANHRWIPNTAVDAAVQKLNSIPAVIGPWTSEELQISDAERTIGCISGYVKREYTNSQTGAQVVMLLVAGDPGPISLHPPTVCFSGRGFHVVGSEFAFAAPMNSEDRNSSKHVFRSADFANPADMDPALIRVYWGWSADGKWKAPDHPRIEFASESALFKLYVSERWLPSPGVTEDTGTGKLFLEAVLPHMTRALSSNGADTSAVTSNNSEET